MSLSECGFVPGVILSARPVRRNRVTHLRCGKSTCHCAHDQGHPVWSLTFMVKGKKHVQHIPKPWVEQVRRRVRAGREFQDAVREVLTANAQLLVLARQQRKKKKRKRS
jgi:hypothetical protein